MSTLLVTLALVLLMALVFAALEKYRDRLERKRAAWTQDRARAGLEDVQAMQLRYRRLHQEEVEAHQERLIRMVQDARKDGWE